MKSLLGGLLVGALLGGGGVWYYTSAHHEPAPSEEKATKEAAHEALPPNTVKLPREMQTTVGLRLAAPVLVEHQSEVTGYGRVLDASTLVTGLMDIELAQNAVTASTREYERISSLYAQKQNASLQALELAEANKKRDELLVLSAKTKLVTAWGKSLTDRSDLPSLMNSLANGQAALVRIDLSPGQAPEKTPPSALLNPLGSSAATTAAEYIGPAPIADAQIQGIGYLYLLRSNAPVPGTAMAAHLASSERTEKGWRIPGSAIIHHEGATWVFKQNGEELFLRIPVELAHPLADDWFVPAGLTAEDHIVVTGAQILLSEQLKSAAAE